jgi:hypothetical protein
MGIGNKSSTTAVLDYLVEVLNEVKFAVNSINIVTLRKNDLLGHDEAMSSFHAESAIQQLLCCSRDPILWMKEHKEKVGFNELIYLNAASLKSQAEANIDNLREKSMYYKALIVLIIGFAIRTIYLNM